MAKDALGRPGSEGETEQETEQGRASEREKAAQGTQGQGDPSSPLPAP